MIDVYILPPVTGLREVSPGYALGRIRVGNALLHFEMIQVEDRQIDDETGDVAQTVVGDEDNQARYDETRDMACAAALETVEWDGREWVIRVSPYAR